eukprot:scaffold23683_cov24-Tisochrysis_lutea.AAC.1
MLLCYRQLGKLSKGPEFVRYPLRGGGTYAGSMRKIPVFKPQITPFSSFLLIIREPVWSGLELCSPNTPGCVYSRWPAFFSLPCSQGVSDQLSVVQLRLQQLSSQLADGLGNGVTFSEAGDRLATLMA